MRALLSCLISEQSECERGSKTDNDERERERGGARRRSGERTTDWCPTDDEPPTCGTDVDARDAVDEAGEELRIATVLLPLLLSLIHI